jgi:hypothetical protein
MPVNPTGMAAEEVAVMTAMATAAVMSTAMMTATMMPTAMMTATVMPTAMMPTTVVTATVSAATMSAGHCIGRHRQRCAHRGDEGEIS